VSFQVGPYCLDELLGHGAEGLVYRAHPADHYGPEVALKVNASLADTVVGQVLGSLEGGWPPLLLETYAAGRLGGKRWIVRELADETLHDFSRRRDKLSPDQVLEIFRVACEGVAVLHAHRVYGWSAHARNLYRVGEQWKLGDFGRVWCFVDPDHPGLEPRRQEVYRVGGMDGEDGEARALADSVIGSFHVGLWQGTGLLPYDPEREHRLKLDDCAMLAGLLVEMLTGKRWEWFFRALNKRPYCSAVYPLTGDRDRNERLSTILNRCWRGDAGGAPLLANGDRGDQSVYDDALELLSDVEAVCGGPRSTAASP
jgi:hypothetical protein